jgi:hypothetical protein
MAVYRVVLVPYQNSPRGLVCLILFYFIYIYIYLPEDAVTDILKLCAL